MQHRPTPQRGTPVDGKTEHPEGPAEHPEGPAEHPVGAAEHPEGPAEHPEGPAEHAVGAVEAIEAAVEGVPAALSLAPSSVMPALGGELVLPAEEQNQQDEAGGAHVSGDVSSDTVRSGLLQAGPLAVAGVGANGVNVLVTVLLARLLTTRGYGQLNQLTGLFLIVSMPGSAVIVAVVRRLTTWRGGGAPDLAQEWARRLHRFGVLAVATFGVAVLASGSWSSGLLGQRSAVGVDAILIAGAVWILLCLDRGLLQSHRSYRSLSVNLLVEGGVRSVAMVSLVGLGLGAPGAALGVLLAEVVTAVHARMAADRTWARDGLDRPGAPMHPTAWRPAEQRRRWTAAFHRDPALLAPVDQRRSMVLDLGAALVALAMIALLQNIDVIVVGRDAPAVSGSYAAVSVASKALVFGAIVLGGGYLLPEAAIRWREGGHALRQSAVTMLLLAVPATALLILALAAPHLLLSLVFSSRYLGAEEAFVPLVLAMVFLSTTVVLTMYLLAVGRRWITAVLMVGAAAATIGVLSAHGAPRGTAEVDLAVQAALALAIVGGFVGVHHRRVRIG
ncbi:MAG: lipopolysaccharide biosynthesis protein [Acidimicrobiales bacterium]